jgi:hypothetical protein
MNANVAIAAIRVMNANVANVAVTVKNANVANVAIYIKGILNQSNIYYMVVVSVHLIKVITI